MGLVGGGGGLQILDQDRKIPVVKQWLQILVHYFGVAKFIDWKFHLKIQTTRKYSVLSLDKIRSTSSINNLKFAMMC